MSFLVIGINNFRNFAPGIHVDSHTVTSFADIEKTHSTVTKVGSLLISNWHGAESEEYAHELASGWSCFIPEIASY